MDLEFFQVGCAFFSSKRAVAIATTMARCGDSSGGTPRAVPWRQLNPRLGQALPCNPIRQAPGVPD